MGGYPSKQLDLRALAGGNEGERYRKEVYEEIRFASRRVVGHALQAKSFALLGIEELLAFWWAAHEGTLSGRAWQTWAALHEIRAAREAILRQRKSGAAVPVPRYSLEHIHELQGRTATPEHDREVRRALRQLERAGLVRWNAQNTVFARGEEAFPRGEEKRFEEALRELKRQNFQTPVSRKLLRHLAKGAKKSVFGCAVAVTIRATGQRRGTVTKLRGCVTSDLVQRIFGLAPRTWRQGLAELEELGVLRREHFRHPSATHRYGVILALAMDWYGIRAEEIAAHLAPEAANSAAPTNHHHLPPEAVSKNPERISPPSAATPRKAVPTGLWMTPEGGHPPIALPSPAPPHRPDEGQVRLENVQGQDLRSGTRLATLAELAVEAGWGPGGSFERQKLEVMALAVHAVRCESEGRIEKSAVHVFMANLRSRRFDRVAAVDEEKARSLLRSCESDSCADPHTGRRGAISLAEALHAVIPIGGRQTTT